MTATGLVRRWARRVSAGWAGARDRHAWLDHLVRAAIRYDKADGGRLSAALTYYAFFATFALALLGFAVLGRVLDDPVVLASVQRYLSENFPRLDVRALSQARGTAGVLASVGLGLAGLFWMDTLRSASRAIWRLEQYPGAFLIRQLIDLGVLAGLGLLLAASLGLAFGAQTVLAWLAQHTIGVEASPARWVLSVAGFLLGLGVNTLLAIALLSAPPRLRLSPRRVLAPALFITAGLEGLNRLGQFYLNLTSANPAYQVVAGAVGMLVFLKIVNQLILFAAALAATSNDGRASDLAAARTTTPTPRPPPPSPVENRTGPCQR